MRRAFLAAATSLFLFACPPDPGNDGGTGGGAGGGGGGSGGATGFNLQTLDPQGGDRRWIAAAYHAASNTIGVAYFVNLGTSTVRLADGGYTQIDGGSGGQIDYAIRYVSWRNGTASAPETIVARVNVAIGIAIDFQPSGEPAVAYVGGGNEEGSLIWLQNDLMLARRSGGTWTETTIAANGLGFACGNPVSDGPQFVAGVWPALAFDSTGKGYLFWRNVHNGQFPVQDWQSSDILLNEIAPGGGVTNICLAEGGNSKSAWGGRSDVVMAKGQPLVIFDQCDVNGPEAEGRNVIWMRRTAANTWTGPRTAQPIGNTQTGATLAYDDLGQDGGVYGIAVIDRGSDTLKYIESFDGEQWTFPDSVYASGSGGWYPSVAFDPINHEPAIAWYLCSLRPGVDESSCPADEDALKVSQRIVGNWRTVNVDNEGGFLPRLGFLNTGKRWVAYRGRGPGQLKLAIER